MCFKYNSASFYFRKTYQTNKSASQKISHSLFVKWFCFFIFSNFFSILVFHLQVDFYFVHHNIVSFSFYREKVFYIDYEHTDALYFSFLQEDLDTFQEHVFKAFSNLTRLGFLKVVFPEGVQFDTTLHISRITNLISIKLYTIVNQPIWSRFKVKKCWCHLLYGDVISFFATRKCQKIRKIDENS